jgi:hypothetical protein
MAQRIKQGKLKPEVKTQWVEALRSGKYKQGKALLFSTVEQSYCCLGVNCAVLNQPYITKYPKGSVSKGLPDMEDAQEWWQTLPNRELIDSPKVKYKGKWMLLVELNDDVGLTFEQIADLIEAQL